MTNKLAIDRCVNCNSRKIETVRGVYVLTIKGRETKIPGVEYFSCASCGERFMDADNSSIIDAFIKKSRKARVA